MQRIGKKTRLLVLFFVFIVGANCQGQGTATGTSKELFEGELVYDVSGATTNSDWAFDVQYNSNSVRINERYARSGSRTYIIDKNNNEVLALFNEPRGGNKKESYLVICTIEEMQKMAQSSSYGDTIKTVTQEFKTIMGYKCQKTIIKLGSQVIIVLWTTDKIKTGVTLPYTPLTFDNVALEYEMKILGITDRKYVIRSISDKRVPSEEFEHAVPDEYNMIVPLAVFSLNSMWAERYEENKRSSFQYPAYGSGRESVKKYIADGLSKIMPKEEQTRITLEFIVSKEGILKNIIVNYGHTYKYSEAILKMLQNMPKWTPGSVKGKPVNARVTIAI